MGTLQIRETLHQYIDVADEKKLEAIYTLLKDSIDKKDGYSVEELGEIYDRRTNYKTGNESTLTTEELITFVRKNNL